MPVIKGWKRSSFMKGTVMPAYDNLPDFYPLAVFIGEGKGGGLLDPGTRNGGAGLSGLLAKSLIHETR